MSNFFQGAYEGWSLIYKLRLHNYKLRNRWYSINGYTERKRGVFEIIIDLIVQSITEVIKVSYRALFGFRVKKVYYTSPETGIKSQLRYSKNPPPPKRTYANVPPPPRPTAKERQNKTFIEWCKDNTGKTFQSYFYGYEYSSIHVYFKGDQLRINVHKKHNTASMFTIVPKVSDNIRNNDFDNKNRLIRIVEKHIIKRYPNLIMQGGYIEESEIILHDYNFEPYGIINDPENGMFIDMSTRPPSRLLNRH